MNQLHYVYKHIDPRSNELLYIGHGSKGRAWTHGSKHTVLRSQEHLDHLESMITDSLLPSDWVFIISRNLDKKSACSIEQDLIRELKPKYNKPQGLKLLKVTDNDLVVYKELRDSGLYYHTIADQSGVSTMTVYRALNGQTKNLRKYICK